MTRDWIPWLLIGLSLGLAGTTCQQTGSPSSAEAGSSSKSNTADEPPADGERGAPCRIDSDCSSYFRCREGTCAVPPAVTGEVEPDTPQLHVHPSDASEEELDSADEALASFHLELAVTPAERSRGLMYRREMDEGWGMLFVYPDAQPRSFWMKNTYIPLDMIFIGPRGRIVHVLEGAEPLTRTPRRSQEPAQYVLELNAGAADAHGLEVGQQIRLEEIPSSLRPN